MAWVESTKVNLFNKKGAVRLSVKISSEGVSNALWWIDLRSARVFVVNFFSYPNYYLRCYFSSDSLKTSPLC